ncbi:putative phage tail protein [Pseudomonas fluorescens]|uniref:putative phage tail protein n=1 Tax=Pseudomonas fluorescens TaxID=294 RepID=UPI003C19DE05
MSEVLIEQLQALLPPVSYDPNGINLKAQLAGEAVVLGDALAGLEEVEKAIFPETAGEFIADWERIYGLTPALDATQDERVQDVLAAMGDLGGQSIPYFIRLASLFGVTASIQSFRIPVVGLVKTGDPIYSGDWPFTWRVDAPLSAYVSTTMEARITERRPGNTDVVFGYGKEVVNVVAAAVDQLFNSVNYVIPSNLSANNG